MHISKYEFLYITTTSESWTLACMLPLLIGDLVPEDNAYWQLFLLLLKIVDIVMAPKCTNGIAAYLRQLIEEHHTTFQELYPDRHLTPKLCTLHDSHSILDCAVSDIK